MKQRVYRLVLLLFLIVAASAFTAHTVSANDTITASKKVKVNKTFKIRKVLNLSKSELKNYTFTTSKAKVATVSAKGVVKGLKKGKAVITVTSKQDGSVYATIKVKVKNRYTASQLRLMSSIIFSEAGNECYAGQKAVGIVIMNRIHSSSFPSTLSGVIYQPYQFGPVRNGSLNRSLSKYDNGTLSKNSIKAAKEVLNGNTTINVNGKTIEFNHYLFFSGYVAGHTFSLGGHQFK